ncbi:MAG: AAA family ATPase [Gammaproteobacteria bacterium]|nr:AAA family ATPase [Gammaproteobacteria bacterium]
MRQFPRSAELEHVLATDSIDYDEFAELARTIASFHESADVASADSPYGTAAEVRRQCLDNFRTIGKGLPEPDLSAGLEELSQWIGQELDRCEEKIGERHNSGRVRECHGDMHVTNMIRLNDRIQVFDCIEFNEEFRWIDVMSEIAFLLMDLDMRGHSDLGRVFLNAYLEAGGDYDGLSLLRLFRVYRSMVRAKIAYLRADQDTDDDFVWRRFGNHIRLAHRYIESGSNAPGLVITRGFSGSGKTTITEKLIPVTGAVRIRSDIERKRLEGLSASERSHSGIGQGLYDPSHTEQTYERLAQCAQSVVKAGLPVIVDATFLKADQRLRFRNLAQSLHVPFTILDCQTPEAVLRQRIGARQQEGHDASEADTTVLDRQLSSADDLTESEQAFLVELDTEQPLDARELANSLGLMPPDSAI